ncbi:YxlC family protein [Bacillus aquiflavi]|uniref:YxlC family protein n=1 Tax=Bacillus aquiflavi TaxID=2672567 RepID=UPI001CA923EC|nr:YxlC family protein [Bacillus aquiflavi]UAC48944.1 YxlC family protein [Bacillus aquiflavi]
MTRKINDKQHETEVIKKINDSLYSIDHKLPIYTPELQWFEQKVAEHKKRIRQSFMKDVFIFALVSLFILSATIFTLYQVPVFFLLCQGVFTAALTVYFTVRFMKRVKKHE